MAVSAQPEPVSVHVRLISGAKLKKPAAKPALSGSTKAASGLVMSTTVTSKAGKVTVSGPAVNSIVTFSVVPKCSSAGDPERVPLSALKSAQSGLFVIMKESVSPSMSWAFGVKLYNAPGMACISGVPVMVGRSLVLVRVIWKLAVVERLVESVAVTRTSTTFWLTGPISALVGVPLKVRVAPSKESQSGSGKSLDRKAV